MYQDPQYQQETNVNPTISNKLAYLDGAMSLDTLKQQQADNVSIHELEQVHLIDRIRHMLAGEVYNNETGYYERRDDLSPPMNAKGVHFFILKFGGHLDKNITLSNFTLEEINQMMLEICYDINEIFFKRCTEFDIKQENMSFIKHILEHEIRANYLRAKDAGERKHRETVIRSVERLSDNQSNTVTTQPQSNGLWGLFGGKKKSNTSVLGGNY